MEILYTRLDIVSTTISHGTFLAGTQHVGMSRNRRQESGKQPWKGPHQVYCFCGSETYVECNKGGLVVMIRGAISMREARGMGRALVPRC